MNYKSTKKSPVIFFQFANVLLPLLSGHGFDINFNVIFIFRSVYGLTLFNGQSRIACFDIASIFNSIDRDVLNGLLSSETNHTKIKPVVMLVFIIYA